MRLRLLQLMLITCFIARPCRVPGQQVQTYPSPDRTLRVKTALMSKTCPESRIKIFKPGGALLFRKQFSSSDCEHGSRIVRAQWTADSQFFVFNVESTGGHQPGHKPVFFYSRRKNQLYRLERFIGYLVAQDFTLEAPHMVGTEKQKRVGESEGIPIKINLRRLLRPRW